jgi:hypothetical protein
MIRRRLIKLAASAALLPSLALPVFSAASADGTAVRPPCRVSGQGTRCGLPQRAGTSSITMSAAV